MVKRLLKRNALDIYLFNKGENFKSYKVLGAHIRKRDGISGVEFTVWAPKAKQVSLVGDFNGWNIHECPMMPVEDTGMWHAFVPEVEEFSLYKYAVMDYQDKVTLKADPFAFFSEVKPNTASRVYDLKGYKWNDANWMRNRKKKSPYKSPLNIYELHLGSWDHHEEGYMTYGQMEEKLIPYIKSMGYTHIEVMPLTEHPFDGSWGYQATGYFSITSRYGTPKDFMSFVDACHKAGIGVLLDWVPCHFCNDEHGLRRFDGTETFEHSDKTFADNELWGTTNFDYAKTQVQSFLISNALFFLEKFHIDGLRVDAVAFMLYQGYTTHQSHVNEDAVNFLQRLNKEVFARYPDVLMMAEESSAWPLVTAPIHDGGLGFNFKWNMGWMNDMLEYMEMDYHDRHNNHKAITFSVMYAFTENFILPLSHDEVVHGKKSLLNKMPGDYWQKFANLRMFYGYMYAYPGKKLLFMGGELGQFIEWDYERPIDWFLRDYDKHREMELCVKDLNHFYTKEEAFYFNDDQYKGFEWIDYSNNEQSIISFVRNGEKENILVVCNFTPEVYKSFELGAPYMGNYIEVLNTDDVKYGGSGFCSKQRVKAVKKQAHGRPQSIQIDIAPLATMYFKIEKTEEIRDENV
ncbi:1,4-alpha-glucan branching protein GlgB [Acidaminobacter sp. JC074]|uniref:1,4-alpha-glucan branching protein GlgB n=1 Tax=Acidaminobacter sp. JC074 TaxID=2530199 RepID=UPI001F0DBFC3|nr:1,4-alpha-glucan branching protein GlgB [Acidaminobacter sp. JC074]MCH4890240.1 1,4-alpha-glucan branching protein GlgB [Acidaminobacter sp. JC074]